MFNSVQVIHTFRVLSFRDPEDLMQRVSMLKKQREAIEQAINLCSYNLRRRSTNQKKPEEYPRKRIQIKRINNGFNSAKMQRPRTWGRYDPYQDEKEEAERRQPSYQDREENFPKEKQFMESNFEKSVIYLENPQFDQMMHNESPRTREMYNPYQAEGRQPSNHYREESFAKERKKSESNYEKRDIHSENPQFDQMIPNESPRTREIYNPYQDEKKVAEGRQPSNHYREESFAKERKKSESNYETRDIHSGNPLFDQMIPNESPRTREIYNPYQDEKKVAEGRQPSNHYREESFAKERKKSESNYETRDIHLENPLFDQMITNEIPRTREMYYPYQDEKEVAEGRKPSNHYREESFNKERKKSESNYEKRDIHSGNPLFDQMIPTESPRTRERYNLYQDVKEDGEGRQPSYQRCKEENFAKDGKIMESNFAKRGIHLENPLFGQIIHNNSPRTIEQYDPYQNVKEVAEGRHPSNHYRGENFAKERKKSESNFEKRDIYLENPLYDQMIHNKSPLGGDHWIEQTSTQQTFMGEKMNLESGENLIRPIHPKSVLEDSCSSLNYYYECNGLTQDYFESNTNKYPSEPKTIFPLTNIAHLPVNVPQDDTEGLPFLDWFQNDVKMEGERSPFMIHPINSFSKDNMAPHTIWNPAHDEKDKQVKEKNLLNGGGSNSSTDGSYSTNDSMRNEGETPSLAELSEPEDITIEKLLEINDDDMKTENNKSLIQEESTSDDENNETTSEDEEGEPGEDCEKLKLLPKESTSCNTVCGFVYDKKAIPFKKRKRSRQLRYPQSRFINCRKIPIFDLTMEEEFRIYNIDFRRNLVWKEYIRLMKYHVPGFDSFKTQIFLSAFGLKRVVVDPDNWSTWTKSAMENHAKSAEIFEEIKSIPSNIWNEIKTEGAKTFSTYGWALCWANADAGDLIGQESKAGLWDKELQVSLIRKMFLNALVSPILPISYFLVGHI